MNAPQFQILSGTGSTTSLVVSGVWKLSEAPPTAELMLEAIKASSSTPAKISIAAENLGFWDSSLFAALYTTAREVLHLDIPLEYSKLPVGLRGLLTLALAVPRRESPPTVSSGTWLYRLGKRTLSIIDTFLSVAQFIGELSVAVGSLLTGRVRMRRNDFLEVLQQAGPAALPIVSLISVLVGLILAYIGAIQLNQFGAQIYVANLVGLAMSREMAGIMAGIILAGRTGAAFAAQLGTMQVNEEIDALKTLGVSPMESLVLPRMIALVAMIPLLCMYAMLAGIIGGLIVGTGVLGISLPLYFEQTIKAVRLMDMFVGVGKSVFFGALVALCGCYHGMRCGRSASAVGEATTAAVVSGIVCVVVADAVFAVICDIIGI